MKVVVVGAGPAGLMAGYFSAVSGNETEIIEKNEKAGKKLYITGKGRCNFTNDCDIDGFLKNVVSNPKFLMSSVSAFTPGSVMEFFENGGLRIKVERGGRVFPSSDKASDVTACLLRYCKDAGVRLSYNEKVISIEKNENFTVTTDKGAKTCGRVIIATGGLSYPLTGSTGDGYSFAKAFGHNVIPAAGALTGIETLENCAAMQGLTLKNINFIAECGNKRVYEEFGELLFTHFGVSGPVVLSCSSFINRLNLKEVTLRIDLKPALSAEKLDERVLRDFKDLRGRQLKNSMDALLPKSIIPVVIERANISPEKKIDIITADERKRLVAAIKGFTLKPKGFRPIDECIVTAGGVDVREINPKTMESKLVKGLFFAGEVIDIDALTGGFNIQAAFSTGRASGISL